MMYAFTPPPRSGMFSAPQWGQRTSGSAGTAKDTAAVVRPRFIIGFVLNYLNHLGGMCGTPAPVFTDREQFLFDIPRGHRIPQFDILVVNAQPTSGQVPEFDNAQMNDLITKLALHNSVICTNPTTAKNALTADCSILRIGQMAQRCSLIVGVATGPIWTTFNRQNRHVRRHILLSPMRLDYGPAVPIACHANMASVEAALQSEGWL